MRIQSDGSNTSFLESTLSWWRSFDKNTIWQLSAGLTYFVHIQVTAQINGIGSPPVQISPVSSRIYPNARHVSEKYQKAQNKPPKGQNITSFSLLFLSVSFTWIYKEEEATSHHQFEPPFRSVSFSSSFRETDVVNLFFGLRFAKITVGSLFLHISLIYFKTGGNWRFWNWICFPQTNDLVGLTIGSFSVKIHEPFICNIPVN